MVFEKSYAAVINIRELYVFVDCYCIRCLNIMQLNLFRIRNCKTKQNQDETAIMKISSEKLVNNVEKLN